MPSDELALWRKLKRVEALSRGATSPGERRAANAAAERLKSRLAKVRAADPIAKACREEIADLTVPPTAGHRQRAMPRERDLRSVLARWEGGDWSLRRVTRWAAKAVDEVTMPEDSSHPDARIAEVLLVLAQRGHGLRPGDVPDIRRFLRGASWEMWFELLARRAAG